MKRGSGIVAPKADNGKNGKNSSGSHGTKTIPTGKGGSTVLPAAPLLIPGLCVCATLLHAAHPIVPKVNNGSGAYLMGFFMGGIIAFVLALVLNELDRCAMCISG